MIMAVDASQSNLIIDLPELIGRLAAHPEPRLREALIPLFIRTVDSSDTVKWALIGKTAKVDGTCWLRSTETRSIADLLQRLQQTPLDQLHHLINIGLFRDQCGC